MYGVIYYPFLKGIYFHNIHEEKVGEYAQHFLAHGCLKSDIINATFEIYQYIQYILIKEKLEK